MRSDVACQSTSSPSRATAHVDVRRRVPLIPDEWKRSGPAPSHAACSPRVSSSATRRATLPNSTRIRICQDPPAGASRASASNTRNAPRSLLPRSPLSFTPLLSSPSLVTVRKPVHSSCANTKYFRWVHPPTEASRSSAHSNSTTALVRSGPAPLLHSTHGATRSGCTTTPLHSVTTPAW